MKPRLLDLFCGAGGAAVGYSRAGFEVVGIDIEPQKNYPFEFHQADAVELLQRALRGPSDWVYAFSNFDVIHASPPCQAYSITKHTHTVQHPDLLGPTRELLKATGLPYIIENVVGADMPGAVICCGARLCPVVYTDPQAPEGLVLKRHRQFESNIPLVGSGCLCKGSKWVGYKVGGVYGGGSSDRNHAEQVRRGGYTPAGNVRRELMGIDWTTINELSQAIPPAYTEFIGIQLLQHLSGEVGE